MARTPEQRAADSRLSDAVRDAADAYGFLDDGATIADFVVVLETVRYTEDPDEFEEFRGVLFRDGATRRSVAVGLLDLGKDLIKAELRRAEAAEGDDPGY
jgi:hypothetical protein